MPSPAKSMWKSHSPVKHFPHYLHQNMDKGHLKTYKQYQFHSWLKHTTAALEETEFNTGLTLMARETALQDLKYNTQNPPGKSTQCARVKKGPAEDERPHLHMQTHPCPAPSLFPGTANQESSGTLISVLKLLILCQPAFSRWKLAHLRSSSSGDSFIRSSRFSPSRSKAASATRKRIMREESNLQARIQAAARFQGRTIPTTDYVKIFWVLAEFSWVGCYTERSINDLEIHVLKSSFPFLV